MSHIIRKSEVSFVKNVSVGKQISGGGAFDATIDPWLCLSDHNLNRVQIVTKEPRPSNSMQSAIITAVHQFASNKACERDDRLQKHASRR
jgi:hypothetical protein